MTSSQTIAAGLGIRLSEHALYAMQQGVSLGLNGITSEHFEDVPTRRSERVEWAYQVGQQLGVSMARWRQIEDATAKKRRAK